MSVAIQNGNRKRRQSSAAQPSPVLDANEPMTTRAEVCTHDCQCMNGKARFDCHAADGPTVSDIVCKYDFQVNFLKKGCGTVCRSNLKVDYRYGHRPTDAGQVFTELEL